MNVVGLALELIFQSLDLIPPLSYASAVVLHMILAILVVSILDLLQYTHVPRQTRANKECNQLQITLRIHDSHDYMNTLYSLCIGLNVCELTECSPVRCCTRCNLCRRTFSDFIANESLNASTFESMPTKQDSSVCVALSRCNMV